MIELVRLLKTQREEYIMKSLTKKITSVALSLIILLSMSACSSPKKETSQNSVFAEIVDHSGKTVVLQEKPTKIVSGYYMISSMLIALGVQDNVVGIEAKAKSRPIYSLSAPKFLDLPSVGSAKEFDLEGCIALKPDLVILPLRLKDAAKAMTDVGINVICVNPEDETLLKETLTMLGQATGTPERAQEIINRRDSQLAELQKVLTGTEKKNVYLAGNSNLLSTAGAKMYQSALIKAANANNVADSIEDSYWANISYEQLLAYSVDSIIIAPAAPYSVKDVLYDNAVKDMKAVKEEKVFKMPNSLESWDSPLPASYLGSLWLAATLYPEKYSYDKFKEEAKYFYETFYGVKVDLSTL